MLKSRVTSGGRITCLLLLPTLGLGGLCRPPAARAPRARVPLASAAPKASSQLVSLVEVEAAARRLGCTLVVRATGPAYRLELLWRGPDDAAPNLLGFSSGFAQPNGVAHLESIQVRRFSGYWERSRLNPQAGRYAQVPRFDQYGLGLLLSVGVACFLLERGMFGCRRAELLAIMDSPKQHATLVRYYRRLGLTQLREVRDGFGSVADQLVWGGVGTLMAGDLVAFRAKWGETVRKLGGSGGGNGGGGGSASS